MKQGNYWVKQKNKTNSDLIWEYVLVCDPWPASEVGIWCVFTALLDWAGRNGSHGWHLQAESEARLILVCSIFLTPSTGMDVDVTVVILAVTETLTLTFRKRPPPTRIPPHGPFWQWRTQREGALKVLAAYPAHGTNVKDSCITVGWPRMEPSKFILVANICCIASHNS